jgi:hypothetical protein
MGTLLIEIQNPKAKKLIDDLVDLGLISLKKTTPSWIDRWQKLSNTLPSTTSILEEDIINEISEVRSKRYFI